MPPLRTWPAVSTLCVWRLHQLAAAGTAGGDSVSPPAAPSEPDRQYSVWLKAVTAAGEGDRSFPVQVMTDVSGPGAPVITNITCLSDTSLVLQWRRPHIFYGWVREREEPEPESCQTRSLYLSCWRCVKPRVSVGVGLVPGWLRLSSWDLVVSGCHAQSYWPLQRIDRRVVAKVFYVYDFLIETHFPTFFTRQ